MANTFTNLGFRCPLQNRWFLGFRDIVSEAFREARINSEQYFFQNTAYPRKRRKLDIMEERRMSKFH